MPSSVNLAVRKEEKNEIREPRGGKNGKSQKRRGAQKPKVAATPKTVAMPTKAPSPAVVLVPPHKHHAPAPAPQVQPPQAASPNNPFKEGKIHRKKIENDPPKTTVRKKKNSETQSISVETKVCSSENDSRNGSKNEKKKKKSHTSSDSAKRKSAENKSDGSKEPSENDEKKEKFNKDLAKNFFKHMIESQRARKRTEDAHLERMPESSQLVMSVKTLRKKLASMPKLPLDNNYFKPNGEPIWVVEELELSQCEKNEDGVVIRNPELARELAASNFTIEENTWMDNLPKYMSCTMTQGEKLPDDYQFDSLAPIDDLVETSKYMSSDQVAYRTIRNLVELCEAAIKRHAAKTGGDDGPTRTVDTTTTETVLLPPEVPSESQLKTCTGPAVTFSIKHILKMTYDRHHPIASIQKLRKKMQSANQSLEKSAQVDSKEKAP